MKAWVRKITVVLGMSATLVTGGLSGTGPALAQPAATPAGPAPLTVNCVNALPPTGGFYRNTRYSQPNACAKCRDEGEHLERTGRWDAHCENLLNPAGTVTAVMLWLRCIACRPATPAAPAALPAERPAWSVNG
jgi:hypothetical protein